jgi:hypothetical protein
MKSIKNREALTFWYTILLSSSSFLQLCVPEKYFFIIIQSYLLYKFFWRFHTWNIILGLIVSNYHTPLPSCLTTFVPIYFLLCKSWNSICTLFFCLSPCLFPHVGENMPYLSILSALHNRVSYLSILVVTKCHPFLLLNWILLSI